MESEEKQQSVSRSPEAMRRPPGRPIIHGRYSGKSKPATPNTGNPTTPSRRRKHSISDEISDVSSNTPSPASSPKPSPQKKRKQQRSEQAFSSSPPAPAGGNTFNFHLTWNAPPTATDKGPIETLQQMAAPYVAAANTTTPSQTRPILNPFLTAHTAEAATTTTAPSQTGPPLLDPFSIPYMATNIAPVQLQQHQHQLNPFEAPSIPPPGNILRRSSSLPALPRMPSLGFDSSYFDWAGYNGGDGV